MRFCVATVGVRVVFAVCLAIQIVSSFRGGLSAKRRTILRVRRFAESP